MSTSLSSYYEKTLATGAVRCIDEEIPFELPSSWEWCRLGFLSNLHIGKTPPRGESIYWSNGIYPWISISDIQDGRTLTHTKEKVSKEAATRLFKGKYSPKGSLIMSFKLSIGKVAILGIDAYHNEAIITILPHYDNPTMRVEKTEHAGTA